MQPNGRHPVNDLIMLRDAMVKETDYLARTGLDPPDWPPKKKLEDLGAPYRIPMPGDRVQLAKVRRCPELNGTQAQVVSGADTEGFVTVRLFADADASGVLKKVHAEKLRPLDAPSTPAFPISRQRSVIEDEAASVFSRAASRASKISRASRRSEASLRSGCRLSPALSASALATLRPPSAPNDGTEC
eukprot:TRINITY_DN107262_c0_g1_i1.p1 TRINITY_DN107262_c0_g1~~TRINITY_DN107262_c0_g1_i1.p1  ORF type:complete len:198 (+),score=24.12 TRINITY_DN107262_c0_g1_i1:33-596(+)